VIFAVQFRLNGEEKQIQNDISRKSCLAHLAGLGNFRTDRIAFAVSKFHRTDLFTNNIPLCSRNTFVCQRLGFIFGRRCVLCATVFLVILIILIFLRKLKFGKFLLIFIQTLAICYMLFYSFWGFNYFRTGLNDRLQISKSIPDTVQFVRVLENLINITNDSYCTFDKVSYREIDSLVESSYKRNASFLKISYPQGARRPKPITLSGFFAKASIAGYYGPFFSEVHLNDSLLAIEYPQVLAHESAHQFGITSEAEANFYGWLVSTNSDSKYLRYSANINMISYFLSQSKHLHNRQELIRMMQKPVIEDMRKIQDHWERLRSEKIDQVAGKVNDVYLKTNKIEKGIEDYFGVVQFVMDFETDTLIQKKANH